MTALQKPTQESVIASIVRVQFHHWEDTQFVSCLVERDDGFRAHGFHNPIDAADFDLEESQRLAYAGAVATLYGLAVSGFFERRAMLAGAHDVLDRCGVGGEDLSGPGVIKVSPTATPEQILEFGRAVLRDKQPLPLPELQPVTQEQRENLRRLLGGHLMDKVQPAGPFEYPAPASVQVVDGKLTVTGVFMPAPVITPAIGSAVIVRMPESFHFPEGAEVIGIVVRDTGTGEPSAIEIAIAFAPGRYLSSSIYASTWSQLELVDRPLTEEEAGHVAALRKRLGADHAHA